MVSQRMLRCLRGLRQWDEGMHRSGTGSVDHSRSGMKEWMQLQFAGTGPIG